MKKATSKLTAILLSLSLSGIVPMPSLADGSSAGFQTLKFDFGAKGTASGYTGVKAQDKYSEAKGYGFMNPDAVEDVSASGKGALSDAVRFKSDVPEHVFNVDLPKGVYKITVTTGDVKSAIVTAEGMGQLYFLTGKNAADSFSIPVTDGQLNIYSSSGVGDVYSFSALEIEQLSTDTKTKPVIWLYGDKTVSSTYNVSDSVAHGWGEYLGKYVDMKKYDIRNMAISGMSAKDLAVHESFGVAEYYGKSGDILVMALGIDDYIDKNISESQYKDAMTKLVKRAKAKGMKVYLVKQHGQEDDVYGYPLYESRWYSAAIDEVASSQKVDVIDMFKPWLELSLDNHYFDQKAYYSGDGLHLNALGSDRMAQMISLELFPSKVTAVPEKEDPDDEKERTVIYEAAASGKAISNPHKGFVMTAYTPQMINCAGGYEYGIGGKLNNRAWDVVTIVSGSPKWNDLNPSEGVYKWDEIDAMLKTCEQYGLTYGIRIMPYSSYLGEDYVPQWVYDKGAKKQSAVSRDDEKVTVVFPKWDDPVYLKAHKDFVTALAKKYDGDPRVEFIDVRPFGDYGEWHNSFAVGEYMPSLEIQKDMLDHYAKVFKKSLLVLPSNARGEIYQYALSLGITKRDDGLISLANAEWSLRPAYRANMPVIGENYWPYSWMRDTVRENRYSLINWTPERFRETIEISHMSIFALDQDSHSSYEFYLEQKDVIDEMCNRLGYNYTVTSAKLNGNKLKVKIKNTGLAPSFFNIDLCAEIMDKNGKKTGSFGDSIKIAKGSFKDGSEKTFEFTLKGELKEGDVICLAMYDCDNPLVKGKDPTVRFDNKNNLKNNKLQLVVKEIIEAKKDNTPTPTITPRATETPTPIPPSVTPATNPETTPSAPQVSTAPVTVIPGKTEVEVDGNKMKVTSSNSVELVTAEKEPVVNVPAAITVNGKSYKVTAISDKAFAGNDVITGIVIGDNITKIGSKAFLGCKNLKSVSGGKSVEVIGKAAFKNCKSLKSVTIGPKVRAIGKDAYRGCKKLKKVIVKTKLLKKKKVGSNAFKGIAKKAVFKIPKKKAKTYKPMFRKVSKGTKIKFQLKK